MNVKSLMDLDSGPYQFEAPKVRPEFLFVSTRTHERINMIDLKTVEEWFNSAPNKRQGRITWSFHWRPRALDGRRGCSIGSSEAPCFRTFADFKRWLELPGTQAHIRSWSDPKHLDRKPSRTINTK